MKTNTPIILILLSIGLFYTFTNVQYQEVKELNSIASKYRDVLDNASRIIELRDGLLIAYEAISETEIERMNKALPDNVDTVRLAFDLDGMASRYGISIKDISASVESSGESGTIVLPEYADAYQRAKVSFSFVSSYDDFMRLLADLERNLRIMDITSISFQSTDSGLYEYKMSVETYWLK
jgi:Tfp pilus assembly protein PilO